MAEQETLLSPTNVLLFGRVLADLEIKTAAGIHDPFVKARAGGNQFLDKQLGAADPKFARIYGFSYAGLYYELETPALFLVHGDGADAVTTAGTDLPAAASAAAKAANKRLARAPDNPSRTGLAATDFHFADGLSVWSFDKGDFSIRMDVSTGPLDQILLDLEGCDASPGIAGSRVSGSRVAGSRVSGSRVSGSRVSGSRVSGSRLSGGGD